MSPQQWKSRRINQTRNLRFGIHQPNIQSSNLAMDTEDSPLKTNANDSPEWDGGTNQVPIHLFRKSKCSTEKALFYQIALFFGRSDRIKEKTN